MAAFTVRLPDDKHLRLKALAKSRGTPLNRLIDEMATLMLAEFDADPSLRLRWHVLQRDRFTCRACGASPAHNAGVELHVDHVVAWSKGGETVLENLQTLCSVCNLGKSNTSPLG